MPPRLLRGEAPRKRGPGGCNDALETVGFSTRFRSPDSLFGDVPELDSRKAAEIAEDREKCEASGLQSGANLFRGNAVKTSKALEIDYDAIVTQ